jgi:hypothetical protein
MMRSLPYLTLPILLACALCLPSAAQQFDENKWGQNSAGVELAAREGPRDHTSTGTVLMYNILGKGFPADKTYDLWFWNLGQKPKKGIDGVSFDKRGLLVCSGKPGSCTGKGPDDPINIQAKAALGEPKRFAVVSRDGRVAGFAEAVPFPIDATDKNCVLSVVLQAPLAAVVRVSASGFTPYEMLSVSGNLGADSSVHSPTAAPDGSWHAIMGTKGFGQDSGKASIKVAGKNCTVAVSFPWGEGSGKEQ